VRGKPRIDIFILHPKGRVSPVQERQMTTVLDANVHNCRRARHLRRRPRIVKTLFRDLPFKERHRLGAVNSINWLRILAQTVYYFYAWGRSAAAIPAEAQLRGAHRQLRRRLRRLIWPGAWGCPSTG
jgi:threonine synthase